MTTRLAPISPVPVAFVPASLYLGAVALGASTENLDPSDSVVSMTTLHPAPGAGAVTAAVRTLTPSTVGMFRVFVQVYDMKLVDDPDGDPDNPTGIGDLPVKIGSPPPKPPKHSSHWEKEIVAQGDGTKPLAVAVGQGVDISVYFDAQQAIAPEPIMGTLQVESEGWTTSDVPVTVIIGQVTTTLSTVPYTVHQNQHLTVPIHISAYGPPTDVTYELWPAEVPGVWMAPTTIHVASPTTEATLPIAIDPSAELGTHSFNIVESAFGDGQRDSLLDEVAMVVTSGAAAVMAMEANVVVAPQQTSVGIKVTSTNDGPRADLSFIVKSAPSGITLDPAFSGITVDAGQTQAAELRLAVGPDAPSGTHPIVLEWTSDVSQQTGSIGFTLTQLIFSFRLDSVDIEQIRSAHSDTDYVSFSLLVDGVPYAPAKTLNLGDVTPGSYPLGLSFDDVWISGPNTKVQLSYAIINDGHTDAETALSTAAQLTQEIAKKEFGFGTGSAITGFIAGILSGGALVAVELAQLAVLAATWGVQLLTANCDGLVAAGTFNLSAGDINGQLLHNSTTTWSTVAQTPGSSSPHGCGKNSLYDVAVSIHPKT